MEKNNLIFVRIFQLFLFIFGGHFLSSFFNIIFQIEADAGYLYFFGIFISLFFMFFFLRERRETYFFFFGCQAFDIKVFFYSMLSGFILFILGYLFWGAGFAIQGSDLSVIDTILAVLICVGLAPLFEEMIFRGFLYDIVLNYTRFGFLFYFCLASVLFYMAHYGNSSLFIFVISFFLCFVRRESGGVFYCFVIHASYNLCVLLYSYINSIR